MTQLSMIDKAEMRIREGSPSECRVIGATVQVLLSKAKLPCEGGCWRMRPQGVSGDSHRNIMLGQSFGAAK